MSSFSHKHGRLSRSLTARSNYEKKTAPVAPSSAFFTPGMSYRGIASGVYDATPAQIATSLRADKASAPTRRLLNQRAAIAVYGLGFGGDDYCCRYSVAWFQLQQADALGISS